MSDVAATRADVCNWKPRSTGDAATKWFPRAVPFSQGHSAEIHLKTRTTTLSRRMLYIFKQINQTLQHNASIMQARKIKKINNNNNSLILCFSSGAPCNHGSANLSALCSFNTVSSIQLRAAHSCSAQEICRQCALVAHTSSRDLSPDSAIMLQCVMNSGHAWCCLWSGVVGSADNSNDSLASAPPSCKL